MLSKTLIFASFFALFAVCLGDYSDTESHLYIDFSSRTAKRGWEGLNRWHWVYAPKGMTLKGVAEPEGGQQVLTMEYDKAGSITSPQLDVSPYLKSCLYVNYYIRVPNHRDYGLTVKTISASGVVKKVWGMSRQDYDVWETAAIPIDRTEKMKIQFSANQSSSGIIAFNGFFLHEGECKDVSPINCDFESEGFCQWTTSDPISQSKAGFQANFMKQPEDHTTDSLFGNTALFASSNRHSVSLFSPIVRSTYQKCFSFAFMRNDDGISASLFESLGENKGWKEVWHPVKNYSPDRWHVVQIPVQITKDTQYKLEITNYQGNKIAALQIDDIKLRPYCLSDLSANFQYGFSAEWKTPKADKFRWLVGTGRGIGADGFLTGHPVALYTDFSASKPGERATATLSSDYVDTVNVLRCLKFDFIISNFGEKDTFTMDIVFQDGKRKTLWEFDYKTDTQIVLNVQRNVAIPAQRDYYRVEFVATSDNPKASATILKVDVENNVTSGECSNGRATKPTVPPTSAPVRKSNISPSVRALVNVMLKNLRSEVQNILHVIADRKDVLYELVGDVEDGLDKALRSIL